MLVSGLNAQGSLECGAVKPVNPSFVPCRIYDESDWNAGDFWVMFGVDFFVGRTYII